VKSYSDQIAVVTGASSGIGRRLATDLARRGATVIGVARRENLLEEVRTEMRVTSPASDTVVCDVAEPERVREILDGVLRLHGRIDVLINNAAVEAPTPVLGGSVVLEPFEHMMRVNYLGAVAPTLAVLPGMLARGSGTIAAVASDVVRAPEPRESAYAASKAALAAFAESVAHEVADRGVHVHVVYPGWVPTAMGMAGIGPDDKLPPKPVRRTEEQVSSVVLDRLGGSRIEINLARLPLLAPIGRTLLPVAYQRGMRKAATR
jgi:short-subunit dehydrogenase